MSELQFPKDPIVGQEYDFPPYKYYWDGIKWKTKGIGYNPVNDLRDELEPRISDNKSKAFEALRRSYADAGLNLVEGSFEEGGVLSAASDVMITASGAGYSWGGPEFPHNVAPGTDPTVVAGYVPRTDVLLRSDLAAPGGSGLIGDFHSVTDKKFAGGASPANTSAQNLAAFLAAKTHAGSAPVYVPSGNYKLTTPFDLGERFFLYGPGTLVFDKAEWRRRGGSTGTLRTSEQYTLFYKHTGNDADIHVFVNTTEVAWSWFSTNVIDVPAAASTTTSDTVSYYIVGGSIRLGDEPQDINGYCTDLAGGSVMQTEYSPSAVSGGTAYNNHRSGSRAGLSLTTGGNNSYSGVRAGASNTTGENNTAQGYQALYRNQGSGNTAVGSIAMEWALTANDCVAFGLGALGELLNGSKNVAIGKGALAVSGGQSNSVVGFEAHNRVGFKRVMGSTSTFGAYAGNYSWGNNNALFGYAAGRGEVDGTTGTDTNNGQQNAFFGYFAGAKISNGSFSVAVGAGAASSAKTASNFTAVGFEAGAGFTTTGNGAFFGYRAGAQTKAGDIAAFGANALEANVSGIRVSAFGSKALKLSTGDDNSAFGFEAGISLTSGTENSYFGVWAGQQATTSSGNTCVGSRAGQNLTTGGFNVNVGRQSGQNLADGANNTNIGATAGRLSQDGTNAVSWTNSTCLGSDSSVSGSNQVQLGNSLTTTYVYGTVQNRSDERDKADVRDTELGIEFIMGLRPVDGRWDVREDYTEEYQVQVGVDENDEPVFETHVRKLPKDGSKKRERFHHWFIAQEVKALCDSLGVEFGGYQDHTINGGCDVLSLGYDEFIPPITKAIQQCWQRMDDIERRLDKLDPPEVSS